MKKTDFDACLCPSFFGALFTYANYKMYIIIDDFKEIGTAEKMADALADALFCRRND